MIPAIALITCLTIVPMLDAGILVMALESCAKLANLDGICTTTVAVDALDVIKDNTSRPLALLTTIPNVKTALIVLQATLL
jgi:hypothetical protein